MKTPQNWSKMTPYEKQLYYMQIVGQVDKGGQMIADREKQPDYLFYIQDEILEYHHALIRGNKVEMLDGLADVLVCVLGAGIQYKSLMCGKDFNDVNFQRNSKYQGYMSISIHDIEGVKHMPVNDKANYLHTFVLQKIWYSVIEIAKVSEFKQYNFNIEGAFNAVMENNLARIKTDENGKVMLEPEFLENGSKNPNCGKVMKIDIKPNLEQFIL